MADELTKRQQDLLKVPGIVFDSIFGGLLYRVQVANENIESNPTEAKRVLAELAVELRRMRVFLVEGDK